LKKKVLFSALLTCGMLLSACSLETDTGSKVGEENGKEVKTEKPAEKKEQVKKVFNVGDKVKLGNAVITVTKVETSKGVEFDTPKKGNIFEIVHIKIENNGKENIDYNPFYFQLKNSNGQISDTTITTVDQDTALQSGELASGGKVEGTVTFEAPENDKKLQLIYQPNMFIENQTVTINLQ